MLENGDTILKKISRGLYKSIGIGKNIHDLSKAVDLSLYNLDGYKPIMPCSIEFGPICCNHSPNGDYVLKAEDMVSYTIGIKKKHECWKTSNIRLLGGAQDDNLCIRNAVYEGLKIGIESSGPDVRLLELCEKIGEVMDSHGIKSVKNICGQCLSNPKKIVPNCHPLRNMIQFCSGKQLVGERYFIDVYGTNLSKHECAINTQNDKQARMVPSIYQIPVTPTKTSRLEYKARLDHCINKQSEIIKFVKNKYGNNPFPAREILENFSDPGNSIKVLFGKQLLTAIDMSYLSISKTPGIKIAHAGRTISITETGHNILC